MKNKFSEIIIVIAVISTAIGASFEIYASKKNVLTPKSGYIYPIGGSPCSISIQCNDLGNVVCTVVYQSNMYQAFGKETPGETSCTVILFRPNL